jgi:hypothetical protein
MQWLALHRPHTMQTLHDHIEHVIQKYRAALPTVAPTLPRTSPTPAAIFNLSADLEYRAVQIFDPAVQLAPAHDRIGRKMRDILPAELVARIERCVRRARKDRRPRSYTYAFGGNQWKGTVIAPTADTVILNVVKVL